MASPLRVGTSGWVYPHWKGRFYPATLRAGDRLAYYASRFDTIELNTTFYGLPQPETLRHWRETVPDGFLFSVKGSRYITHRKKLLADRASLNKFFRVAEALGDKLGPVLFQLPPHWKANQERLASFLKKLPRGFHYAFEFRDATWWNPRVNDLLSRHGAALCIFDLDGQLSPLETTAGFVYVRLHGPAQAYRGHYSPAALRKWAEHLLQWKAQRKQVFIYFDNDEKAYAASDALKLWDLVARRK